jgi:hypothetical protein
MSDPEDAEQTEAPRRNRNRRISVSFTCRRVTVAACQRSAVNASVESNSSRSLSLSLFISLATWWLRAGATALFTVPLSFAFSSSLRAWCARRRPLRAPPTRTVRGTCAARQPAASRRRSRRTAAWYFVPPSAAQTRSIAARGAACATLVHVRSSGLLTRRLRSRRRRMPATNALWTANASPPTAATPHGVSPFGERPPAQTPRAPKNAARERWTADTPRARACAGGAASAGPQRRFHRRVALLLRPDPPGHLLRPSAQATMTASRTRAATRPTAVTARWNLPIAPALHARWSAAVGRWTATRASALARMAAAGCAGSPRRRSHR